MSEFPEDVEAEIGWRNLTYEEARAIHARAGLRRKMEVRMVESAEGIGGRKWSLAKQEDGTLALMEGTKKLATLTEDGAKVMHLLAKAPQLWAAANEHLIACQADESVLADCERLRNAVAAAVNKTDWDKVLQAEV